LKNKSQKNLIDAKIAPVFIAGKRFFANRLDVTCLTTKDFQPAKGHYQVFDDIGWKKSPQ